MEDLNRTYASLLTNESPLYEARAISPDGRYIVGYGYNAATGRNEAFPLDTGPRCAPHSGDVDNNGCVDDGNLLTVLFAFGSTGSNLSRVDVNCDQTVDDTDLLQVLFNFGSGCYTNCAAKVRECTGLESPLTPNLSPLDKGGEGS